MDDRQQKRPSLRGLGRQIMRGSGNQNTESQDQPRFESDEDVRQWMQAQVSNEIPDDWIPADEDVDTIHAVDPGDLGIDDDLLGAPEPTKEDIYADPNFDEIFGDFKEPEPPPAPQILPDDKTQILPRDEAAGMLESSLDELFSDEDPEFDTLFGDVATEADLIPPDIEEHTFMMPDEVAVAHQEFDEPPQPTPISEYRDDIPTPEEAFRGLIGEGVEDYTAPRADRRSPELEYADTAQFDPAFVEQHREPQVETVPEDDLAWLDEVEQAQMEPPYEPGQEYAAAEEELIELPQLGLNEVPEYDWLEETVPVEETLDQAVFADSEIEPAPPELQVEQNWMTQELSAVEPVDAEEEPYPPVSAAPAHAESSREAIPPVELTRPSEPVDLRNEHVYRGALAGITPQEPEEFTPGQRPASYYEADSDEKKTESPLSAEGVSEMESQPLGERRPASPSQPPDVPPVETAADLPQDELETAFEEVGGSDDYTYDIVTEGAALGVPTRGMLDEAVAPFDREQPPRKNVADLIRPIPLEQTESDPNLLKMLVNDTRIKELFNQIDAMQEEVVSSVRGDRGSTDTYQEDLLAASNLLTRSRENYDEARAIVFRVRADLNRERRVDADIERHRPTIMRVYIGITVGLVLLLFIGQAIIDMTERAGIAWIGQGYYPSIFGAFGALLFSYRTLNKHISVQRDFDAVHLTWYLMNPFIGILMGFLMYLVFVFTILPSVNLDVSDISDINSVVRVDVLLAFIAGYTQNAPLDALRDRFTPSTGGDSTTRANEK